MLMPQLHIIYEPAYTDALNHAFKINALNRALQSTATTTWPMRVKPLMPQDCRARKQPAIAMRGKRQRKLQLQNESLL